MRGVCMFCPCGFQPSALFSSHGPKACMSDELKTLNSKLAPMVLVTDKQMDSIKTTLKSFSMECLMEFFPIISKYVFRKIHTNI